MGGGHEEDTSFKKCRITRYNSSIGLDRGKAHSCVIAQFLQLLNIQHYLLELKSDGGEGRVGWRKTQKGKQNTTSLQVKVLMPIILLLTSIFELLEMEVF